MRSSLADLVEPNQGVNGVCEWGLRIQTQHECAEKVDVVLPLVNSKSEEQDNNKSNHILYPMFHYADPWGSEIFILTPAF